MGAQLLIITIIEQTTLEETKRKEQSNMSSEGARLEREAIR